MPADGSFAVSDHHVETLDPGFLLSLLLFGLGGRHLLLNEERRCVSLLSAVVDSNNRRLFF